MRCRHCHRRAHGGQGGPNKVQPVHKADLVVAEAPTSRLRLVREPRPEGVLIVFVPARVGRAVGHFLRIEAVPGIEVAHGLRALQLRDEGHGGPAAAQGGPVQGLRLQEPGVALQVGDAALEEGKALVRNLPAEPAHDPSPKAIVVFGNDLVYPLARLPVDAGGTLGEERSRADHELVEQDAQRPPVDGASIACPLVDLGGLVFGGAAHGVGAADGRPEEAGEAEVAELGVAPDVQDHVLHLEVAVHDAPLMHVLERQNHASRVELRVLLKPPEVPLEVDLVEVPAASGLHEYVQVLLPVERGREPRHKGTIQALHDQLL
mmetsp:Transcript_115120/g.358519  ORF Transcript_115120/g.358519 Transcript_115120/m.358519 type:complete len:320 (+) Transcript_115120:3-962(+)